MTRTRSTDVDVLVVGAGVSGLATARVLQAAGRSVRVVEARERPGGRILSAPVRGGVADLGPTWFWPGERRVEALMRALDQPTHDQHLAGDVLLIGRGQPQRARGPLAAPAIRFSNGAQAMTDTMAAQLTPDTIDFGSPVQRVEPGAEHLLVHTAETAVTCSAVVLALPPSLAMSGGLVDPESLDQDVASVAAEIPVWMGGITKAVAVYEQPFWRQMGLSGMVSAPFNSFQEIHDMSGPSGSPAMLFGFGLCPPGGPSLTEQTFVAQLSALFGDMAASPVEVLILDWAAEPFTTPPGQGRAARYDLFGCPLLRQPSWDGRLHWTSTETGSIAPGHIEGALEAAERTIRML